MKRILFLILSVSIGACSYHGQETTTVLPEEKTEEVGVEKDPVQILLNAITSGDLQAVKNSIEVEKLDVNTYSADGLTLIMVAIRQRQYEIMEYLVQAGADLNQQTKSVDYPTAVDTFGYVDSLTLSEEEKGIYQAILTGEDIATDSLGLFLYQTIQVLQVDLFKWLLKKGADPNFESKPPAGGKKMSPLIFLLDKGYDEGTADYLAQEEIFESLVTHDNININLRVKRKTALKKVRTLMLVKPYYKKFETRLLELGATR